MCLKNKQEHDAAVALTNASLERLLATGVIEVSRNHDRDAQMIYLYNSHALGAKSVYISSRSYVLRDRVDLELSGLSVEQAERILKMLME